MQLNCILQMKSTDKMKKNIVSISLTIIFIAFLLPLILVKWLKIDFSNLGTYGDFFGCFNALVSALAFGGLIYTIYLQRKDLELQRNELQLTRDEMKRQAEAQEKAAQEQERHAKLLEEQLYKEIRPYLNTYFSIEGYSIYLVIKNIGKSACYNFSMKVKSYHAENEFAEELLTELKTRIEATDYSVIPSGLDYVVKCDISDHDISANLMNSSVNVTFTFYFRNQKEEFTIPFKFDEIQSHGDPVARALFAIANRMPHNSFR